MTRYNVSATVSYIGVVTVEAATPEDAIEVARGLRAMDFEIDTGTSHVEFNVTPVVTPA